MEIKTNKILIRDPDTKKYEPFLAIQGESAYTVAKKYGYKGTEEEWANEVINTQKASLEAIHEAGAMYGGIAVSPTEPTNENVDAWIIDGGEVESSNEDLLQRGDLLNSTIYTESEKETFRNAYGIVGTDDIAQELGDNPNKVVSQEMLSNTLMFKRNFEFESGGISSSTGQNQESEYRYRTIGYIDMQSIHNIISTTIGYICMVYDKHFGFLGIIRPNNAIEGFKTGEIKATDFTTKIANIKAPPKYIRLVAYLYNGTKDNVEEDIIYNIIKSKENTFEEIKNVEDHIYSTTKLNWKQGWIGAGGQIFENVKSGIYTEHIPISSFHYIKTFNNLQTKIVAYDSENTFLGLSSVKILWTYQEIKQLYPSVEYISILATYNGTLDVPLEAKQDILIYVSNFYEINNRIKAIEKQDYWKKQRQRFSDKPIMIAYSDGAALGHINTEIAYLNAAIAGFEWLKGDVQPTSDGKLIMCHDDGFTFNDNGKISSAYSATSEKTRMIHDITYDECMTFKYERGFRYSSGTEGYYHPGVCDLERFLTVCREFGTRPYIVIRKNYMDVVIPELLRLLEAYDFTDNCIVNSFELDSVKQVAEQSNHRVMISVVKEYNPGTGLTIQEINDVLAASPNSTINIYTSSSTNEWNNSLLAEKSREAINYAKSINMVIGSASVYKDAHKLFQKGFGLMQCMRPCIQNKITPLSLCILINNGVATVESYLGHGANHTADIEVSDKQIILRNIRLHESTRDFSDGITPGLGERIPYTLNVIGKNVTTSSLIYTAEILINFDKPVAEIGTTSSERIYVKFAYGI